MKLSTLEQLKLYSVQFRCESRGIIEAGPFWGSALHGALGHSLRQMYCRSIKSACNNCAEAGTCTYYKIFFPSPPAGHLHAGKYAEAPHFFIIQKPIDSKALLQKGDHFTFNLTIVGNGINSFNDLAAAFIRTGETGFGKQRGKFTLTGIAFDKSGDGDYSTLAANQSPEPLPVRQMLLSDKDRKGFIMKFLTPLHLKSKGKVVKEPSPELLFSRLSERLHLLNHFYCDAPSPDIVQPKMEAIKLNTELETYHFSRYSSRHGKQLQLSGLLGTIDISGEVASVYPLLKLGTYVNVGKMAALGMGQYQLKNGR